MIDWTWGLQVAGTGLGALLLGYSGLSSRAPSRAVDHTPFTEGSPLMPPVSVIIPARNEADNLKTLLPLLRSQEGKRIEIIVVDDGSTDGTATIAASYGAHVVEAPPLPTGWQGKSWACWSGAAVANGNWFVFLDADTRPAPDFVERVGQLLRLRGGLVTLQPYHEAPTFREQWSVFFNTALAAGSGAMSWMPGRRTAFGPCAVCWRSDYNAVDGHQAVRGEVLEHLELGERFRSAGLVVSGAIVPDILQFRMYPSGWRQLLDGWTKSIALGAGSSYPVYLMLTIAWMTALLGCAMQLFGLLSLADGWGQVASALVAYAAASASVGLTVRRLGSFQWYTALLYPLFLIFFFGLFGYAILRSYVMRRVSWKGRTIDVR